MAGTISIVPTGQEPEPIDIDTGSNLNIPVVPEIASTRAYKAKFGLVNSELTYDDIYSSISNGEEEMLRHKAAAELEYQKSSAKRQAVLDATEKKGSSLTAPEFDLLIKRIDSGKSDPKSIFEEQYANEYVNFLDSALIGEQTFWEDISKEEPEKVAEIKEIGRTAIAKREFVNKQLEDISQALKNQSILGTGVDIAKMLVPFYYEYQLRGNLEKIPAISGMLGDNLYEQSREILSLPFEQYKEKLTEIVTRLKEENLQLAYAFALSVRGQSTSDRVLNDLFTLFEIPAVSGVVKAPLKGYRLVKARQMMKDIVKSTESAEANSAVLAEAAGDLTEAAVKQAAANITVEAKTGSSQVSKIVKAIPAYLRSDVQAIRGNPGGFSRELLNRLEQAYGRFAGDLVGTIYRMARVERITPFLASERFVRILKDKLRDSFVGLDNSILDISNPRRMPVTNTWAIDINIGKPNGELFFRFEEAKNFAKFNKLLEHQIVPKGKGYFIQITKPLNETDDVVRDALVETGFNKTPGGYLNSFIGWLRTSEETLAVEQRMNRKVATYAPAVLLKVARDQAKFIRKLSSGAIKVDPLTGRVIVRRITGNKERWNDWERIVKLSRNTPDPKTGEIGYFFRSPGELQDAYQLHLKRIPDDVEVEAYFAFTRMIEMDRILRNIAVYRNKWRVGTEQHRFSVLNDKGDHVFSDFFEGVIRKDFPFNDDGVLLVPGKSTGEDKIYHLKDKSKSSVFKEWGAKVQDGRAKIIEIYDPESRPLSKFGKTDTTRVRYVVVDTLETKPISWDQVPRRGGGHFEYDYDFYIKQAIVHPENIGGILRNIYEGDRTVMPIAIRLMGKDAAEKLDRVRQLIKRKRGTDVVDAKRIVETDLGMPWKEVRGWFKASKGRPAMLNLNEPIQVVPNGKTIGDLDTNLRGRYRFNDTDTFIDGTKTDSLARQNQVAFTGERDVYELYTLNDYGSRNNPLYKYEPAKFIDPIPTMDRALSRIINSTFLDDYKLFSIENWLAESGKYLAVSDPKDLRRAPMYHFYNTKFRDATPPEISSRLENARWQIQQLLGTQDKTASLLQSAAQKMVDEIYGRFGPKGLIIDPVWLLPKLTDPIKFVRQMTFHMSLGMYALPQLWVQSQTFVTIAGIAGARYAGPGSAAALMTQWARINGKVETIIHMDKILSQIKIPGMSNWKLGQYKEAYDLLESTGLGHVQGEYAMVDNFFSPRIVSSGLSRFMDAGTIFFRGGERNVRYGGWFTAYREFRDKFPTKRITNVEKQQILERADLLTVNMSRASSSLLHQGILSIPFQFLTYPLRMAELVLGKRLTPKERMRLLAWNAAFYGVPTSLGVTGVPLGDWLRKSAIENGYVMGDNYIDDLVTNGLPAVMLYLATGNQYNVGDRYGVQGFEFIREALRSDEPWWNIVGGAAFSKLSDIIEGLDGFTAAMMSGIRDDDQAFPMTIEDIIEPFKAISSANNAWRFIAALNTGRWLSKREVNLVEPNVTPLNALFMTVSGLQPQEVADMHLKSWSLKDQEALEKYAIEWAVKEMRRGFRIHTDSPEQARQFYGRAFAAARIGGLPEHKIHIIISRAAQGNEALVSTIDWKFYVENRPRDQEQVLKDAFVKQLKIKNRGTVTVAPTKKE